MTGIFVSGKSEIDRLDAACGIGMIARELCESIRIFTFSEQLVEVPARRGFALGDAIVNSQPHMGTYVGRAVRVIDENLNYDRLIVITDEQSHDVVPNPKGKGYMINVASYKNGIGYGAWIKIDGWSDAVLDYISEESKI